MNQSFLIQAYNAVWLDQTLPPFTAWDAAYIPFSTKDEVSTTSSNGISINRTLTSTTSMLNTRLQCVPANIYNFSSVHCDSSKCFTEASGAIDANLGCKADFSALYCSDLDSSYCFSYTGYLTPAGLSLQTMGCPANASNLYLAISATPKLEQVTAEFCQPTYWIQEVNLTVTEQDQAVVSSIPLGLPTELTLDDFNATTFQTVIWSGLPVGGSWRPDEINGDVIDIDSPLGMSWRLSSEKTGFASSGSFMTGFAVGATRFTPEAYLQRETLISSLEKAHQLLFSLAMNGILTTDRNVSALVPVTTLGSLYTISVIRPLALVVEALLGCAVIGVVSLLFICIRRPSYLTKDPASLTDLASMLESADEYASNPNTSSAVIHNSNGVQFSLQASRRWNVPAWLSYRQLDPRRPSFGYIIPNEIFTRPFYLGPITGFIFVSLLLGAIATLVTLRLLIDRHNGLSLPFENPVAIQIVLSYIPVTFSTFLEPYWLLLNRMSCLLQPFEELKGCRAKAERSLDLRYSSLPPSLAFWRALRAKHYLLLVVCSISLLANVLTVSLGALLNPNPTTLETSINLQQENVPIFNSSSPVDPAGYISFKDYFYIAESNLSTGTNLPPWTSRDTSFLPVSFGNEEPAAVTLNTYGFNVALACNEVSVNNATYEDDVGHFSFNTTIIDSNGHSVQCYFSQAEIYLSMTFPTDVLENAGFETVAPLFASQSGISADEAAICTSTLSIAYLRYNAILHTAGSLLSLNETSSLYLVCQPTLQIANYSVTLSQTGQILSSIAQTQPSGDLSGHFAASQNVSDLYSNLHQLVSHVYPDYEGSTWQSYHYTTARLHNDAFAYSWFTYLITQLLNSRDTVNTSMPAPSAATMIPAASALYSQLAATILSLGSARFFLPAPNGTTVPATVQTVETRVFMSHAVFYVCCAVLTLDVIVAIAYYRHRPQQILPYLPTTLASILCTFEGSSLAAARGKWDPTWLFGFGKFTGTDGRLRVGIERWPFVQPLPQRLQKRDLNPLMGWDVDQGKLRRRKSSRRRSKVS